MEDQEAAALAAEALVGEAALAAVALAAADLAALADITDTTDIFTRITIIIIARDFSSSDRGTITTAADITAEAVLAQFLAHLWRPS